MTTQRYLAVVKFLSIALALWWLATIPVLAQAPDPPKAKQSEAAPQASPAPSPHATQSASTASHRYQPDRFAGKAGTYYPLVWGVDSLSVKSVESGELIRFSYRVVDEKKAEIVNDKRSEPELIDPKAGVKLVVPSLEKVGKLRQGGPPVAGKSYWMAFSNKGGLVKRGDHVTIVIGQFRAEGLVVD